MLPVAERAAWITSVLRDAPRRRRDAPQDDEVLYGNKSLRHPEEPAKRASRRTHARAPGLLLRRQQVAQAVQGEVVAGNPETGDDALADRGGLRGRAAPDRVRDMHL